MQYNIYFPPPYVEVSEKDIENVMNHFIWLAQGVSNTKKWWKDNNYGRAAVELSRCLNSDNPRNWRNFGIHQEANLAWENNQKNLSDTLKELERDAAFMAANNFRETLTDDGILLPDTQ